MDNRKSATFNLHCFKAFEPISNELIKTFTVDRGKEFAGYNEIENRLNTDVYFADPYASWQRGTNENINGLLREIYPKRFDFSTITQNELDVVVNIINNRPSKCLGYKTFRGLYCNINITWSVALILTIYHPFLSIALNMIIHLI